MAGGNPFSTSIKTLKTSPPEYWSITGCAEYECIRQYPKMRFFLKDDTAIIGVVSFGEYTSRTLEDRINKNDSYTISSMHHARYNAETSEIYVYSPLAVTPISSTPSPSASSPSPQQQPTTSPILPVSPVTPARARFSAPTTNDWGSPSRSHILTSPATPARNRNSPTSADLPSVTRTLFVHQPGEPAPVPVDASASFRDTRGASDAQHGTPARPSAPAHQPSRAPSRSRNTPPRQAHNANLHQESILPLSHIRDLPVDTLCTVIGVVTNVNAIEMRKREKGGEYAHRWVKIEDETGSSIGVSLLMGDAHLLCEDDVRRRTVLLVRNGINVRRSIGHAVYFHEYETQYFINPDIPAGRRLREWSDARWGR